ncbi:mechanosensitive ion channel family protein [Ottowia oryzae]|uniref:mechanosensitive ion channel family protein n=1 Tax=Ottowia oryzae TaxID=2109914 RepID=UPI001FE254B1|nr:mechanosensitive ion channel domain-containing protein [Ottowia oryzae]
MADAPSLSEAGARLSRSAGLRIDDWQAWVAAVTQPAVLADVAAVAACCLVAWAIAYVLRARTRNEARSWGILLGDKGFDGVLFPALCLLLSWSAREALTALDVPTPLFRIALPALAALVIMRLGVRVLRAAFPTAAGVGVLERSLSWLIWLVAVLWIIGLLPVLLEESESVRWKVGGVSLSLRSVLEAGVNVAVTLLLALWLSAALESRLLRNAKGDHLSTRKMIANVLRVLLMFVAVLVSLSAVGIDLTALSVLGGAIGVGIGLGLQKLASNYVSGFVVLSERAIRIGDVIKVDGFEGQITDIRARYTVIRGLSGREAIVPNDSLVTQRIENLSLADRRVWQTTVVSVGYDSDVDLVRKLLREAAFSAQRVLRQPGPEAYLTAFGDDGLEFTVGYWMSEPEAGQMGLRSEINLAILAALRANGIDIPFPQRVVHQAEAPAPPPAPPA